MLTRLTLILVTISALAGTAYAATGGPAVTVTGDYSSVPLLPRTVLMDPDGSLSPAEALARLAAPNAEIVTAVRSHGYSGATIWARIAIDVAPEAAGRWYFSLELPNFDRLQVFTVSKAGVPVPFALLGDMTHEVKPIESRFHLAPMDLPPGRTVLLVKGRTSSTVTLSLKLRKLVPLLLEEQKFFALQAFYLGIAAIFAVSSLGLFAYSRQLIYLIYLSNLIGHSFLWLIINGTGPGHLWPEIARAHHVGSHFFTAVTIASTAAFSACFLTSTRISKTVRRVIWGITAAGAAMMVLCAVTPIEYAHLANKMTSNIVLPGAAALLAMTGLSLYRGEPSARPLMVTWVGLICAVLMAWSRDIGIIPNTWFTLTGAQLGSVFEMIVFAYMLLQRLGRLQSERDRIQWEALASAREQEQVLERRVADRTSELNAAIERERDARRLQQQFVSMVSHEFRNPLAIIDSAAQNLPATDFSTQTRLEKIRSAVRRLRRMIDTCLLDERVQGGAIGLQPEKLELCEAVEEVVDMLSAATEAHRFQLDLPDIPVMIFADPHLLGIALSNIMDNAVKYSPPGSVVDIRVSFVGNEAEVLVTDCGPGVPASERERIFERYYRYDVTAGSSQGAGLGLHLVRSILTAHGGTVICLSGPDGGSRFRLRLPVVDSRKRAAR